MTDRVAAIIVAGGTGSRFLASMPKQFVELAGRPLLAHTLARFEECQSVDEIVLVLPREGFQGHRRLMEGWAQGSKPLSTVPGGEERQHSTAEGLDSLPATFRGLVVVHDGARPLVNPGLICRVVEAAARFGGALACLPIYETVKEVGEQDIVLGTVDRRRLYRAQTPQCFRYDILRRAMDRARTEGFVGTDEAQLVERLGVTGVRMVVGSERNLKVTTMEDMDLAEHLLTRESN